MMTNEIEQQINLETLSITELQSLAYQEIRTMDGYDAGVGGVTPARLDAVTSAVALLGNAQTDSLEEVQAVARRYFDDDTLSTARLEPQALGAKRPRSPFAAARH